MKAVTLYQPWASLIALGVKTIETRSWSTKHRGPLAIHAGKGHPGEVWVPMTQATAMVDAGVASRVTGSPNGLIKIRYAPWLPLGAVVATCDLIDCVPMVTALDEAMADQLVVDSPLTLALRPDNATGDGPTSDPIALLRDIDDQRPYGDFQPGRWAWLLDNIQPLEEPVPVRGRQGLWVWEQER